MQKHTEIKPDCCNHLNNNLTRSAPILKKALRRTQEKRNARPNVGKHPDHSIHIKKLNRVSGQIEGIKRMIEEQRYCPDILVQARAAGAALKAIEMAILETHLRHCVSDALASRDVRKATSKMGELIKLVSRF